MRLSPRRRRHHVDRHTDRTAGDDPGEAALVALYERHVDEVFRFALARTGAHAVAQDVTSDVFLAAARRLAATSRDDARPVGPRDDPGGDIDIRWLIGVARNRIIDRWRRSASDRERVTRLGRERTTHADLGTDESGVDRERVRRALRSLPERQRAVVAMRYLDEMGVGEIADQLELGYRTTESLLARGRRNFRRAFEEGS